MSSARPPVKHLQNTGHHWLDSEKEVVKDYEFQEFPKHMHHKTKASVIVQNPAEQAKLGKDWATTPAAFLPKEVEEVEVPATPAAPAK